MSEKQRQLVAGTWDWPLRFGGRKCMRIYGLNFYTSAHKAATATAAAAAAKLCVNFLPCQCHSQLTLRYVYAALALTKGQER